MEKTRIKISYAHDDKTGFQGPDLMIIKEWYDTEDPDIVTWADCIYEEDKQVSGIYYDGRLLEPGYDEMLLYVKKLLNLRKNILATKAYSEFTKKGATESYTFIRSLPEFSLTD